jgi:signal transduction histidine kinase
MVAKATNDSIYDWNLSNNVVIRSGDGLQALFGYDPETINSDAAFWSSRVHPDDYDRTYQKLNDALNNPDIFLCKAEYRFRKADGNYAHVFDKGIIIRNEKGEAIRMIGATQDQSDMKMTEKHLKDLLNITRDQNKRLQNFAHIVSHNIRSHSSNISGLMELLGEHEDARLLSDNHLFSMLKTSTLKLSETIENLNDIITVQNETNKQKSRIDLNSEIEKTCDAISVLISKTKTRLVNKIAANTFVNVIPSYLESILLNLLTNAIKYKSPDRDPVIELTSRKIEDYLVVTIRDNGIGIDMAKHRDKLFGMYKTFHNNKDARGFGLFITKNQIEAMNGKIEIESTLGTGTTFKLYIYEKN